MSVRMCPCIYPYRHDACMNAWIHTCAHACMRVYVHVRAGLGLGLELGISSISILSP